jgi:hypothetical protein
MSLSFLRSSHETLPTSPSEGFPFSQCTLLSIGVGFRATSLISGTARGIVCIGKGAAEMLTAKTRNEIRAVTACMVGSLDPVFFFKLLGSVQRSVYQHVLNIALSVQ